MKEESGDLPLGTIVKDGYYWCVACNCWATESHLQGSKHERAMKWWHQAASPAMVCNPSLHQNMQTWGAASAEVVREGYFPPAWGDRNCFVWKPETSQWWCRLCYKYADDNHIASATHVKRAAYPNSYLYDGTSSHHRDFSGPPPLPPPSAPGASSSRDSIRKQSPWAALDCEDPLPSAYSPHTAATQPPPPPRAQAQQACPLPSSQGPPPDTSPLHWLVPPAVPAPSRPDTPPPVVHQAGRSPPPPPPSATEASMASWWSQPALWTASDFDDPLPSAYSLYTAAIQPPPLPGAQPLQACPLPSSQGSPPDVPSLHWLTSTSPSVVHKVDSLNDGSVRLAPWALAAFGSSSHGSGTCTSTNADLGHAASCVPDAAAQAPTHLMPTRPWLEQVSAKNHWRIYFDTKEKKHFWFKAETEEATWNEPEEYLIVA